MSHFRPCGLCCNVDDVNIDDDNIDDDKLIMMVITSANNNRQFTVVLDIGTLTNKDAVLAQISTESTRMLIANGLNDKV